MSTLQIVNTMVDLLALPSSGYSTNPTVLMLGYYAIGDAGGGMLNWNASDTRTHNAGTIIKPTDISSGAGRLNRITAPFTGYPAAWFGVKDDDSTDNLPALQACIDAAYNYGPKVVVFGTTAAPIRFSGTLNLYPGITLRGNGKWLSNLHCTASGTTTPAFKLELGNLNTALPCPRFVGFFLQANWAIKLNDPSHGFTNDDTSQSALADGLLDDFWCCAQDFSTIGTKGIQISKGANLRIYNSHFQGYDIPVTMHGTEIPVVRDCWMEGALTKHFEMVAHNTFGNGAKIQDNFITVLADGGTSVCHSSYLSLDFSDNWIEGGGTVGSVLWIDSPTSGQYTYRDNHIGYGGSDVTDWLKVDDTSDGTTSQGLVSLIVDGNDGSGLGAGSSLVNFNSDAGIAYFAGSGGLRRKIGHRNNAGVNADLGFPFNSVNSNDALHLGPGVMARFNPSLDGLGFVGYGPKVKCRYGYFALDSYTSSDFLEFGNTDSAMDVDDADLWVKASGYGAAIYGACVDSSGNVSPYGGALLYSTPIWVKLKINSVSAKGCRVYATGAPVQLYEAVLIKHSYPTS